jgi:hypothetical protein
MSDQEDGPTVPTPDGPEQIKVRLVQRPWFPWAIILLLFVVAGSVTGGVDEHNPAVQMEEPTVLSASSQAAIGLLAVILAAVALLVAFMSGPYKRLIETVGIKKVFAPFVVIAVVSAGAAIVGFVGTADNNTGPIDAQAVIFGIAVGLFVASVAGVVYLVWFFFAHAQIKQAADAEAQKLDKERLAAQSDKVVALQRQLEQAEEQLKEMRRKSN